MIWWFLALVAGFVEAHEKCAFQNPSAEQITVDEARMKRVQHEHRRKLQYSDCQDICKLCIEVPVAFHLIGINGDNGSARVPHPTLAADAYFQGVPGLTDEDFTSFEQVLPAIDQNMAVLNDAFRETPFYFTLMREEIQLYRNELWSQYPLSYGKEIAEQVAVADLKVLNVYLVYNVGEEGEADDGSTTLGSATFPAYQYEKMGDGVYMRFDTLSGGGFPLNDIGYTLPHEVGHWLGLYHTFQNTNPYTYPDLPCLFSNQNDFVDDTPTMAWSSDQDPLYSDCELVLNNDIPVDSCPTLPGRDPYFNLMNYISDEACYLARGKDFFTCGQIERMWLHYHLYREEVSSCPGGQSEITIIMVLSNNFEFVGNGSDDGYDDGYGIDDALVGLNLDEVFRARQWTLEDENGKLVFDSNSDYINPASYQFGFQDAIAMDLCLSSSLSYVFTYTDTLEERPPVEGKVEVFRDDKLVQRIDGSLGRKFSVAIRKDAPPPPPPPPPPSPPSRPPPPPTSKGGRGFFSKGGTLPVHKPSGIPPYKGGNIYDKAKTSKQRFYTSGYPRQMGKGYYKTKGVHHAKGYYWRTKRRNWWN